jgi:hypothetical protein
MLFHNFLFFLQLFPQSNFSGELTDEFKKINLLMYWILIICGKYSNPVILTCQGKLGNFPFVLFLFSLKALSSVNIVRTPSWIRVVRRCSPPKLNFSR